MIAKPVSNDIQEDVGENPVETRSGKWALVIAIVASLMMIGLPFLGPLFFVAIPILFVLTLPCLIWFFWQKHQENLTRE